MFIVCARASSAHPSLCVGVVVLFCGMRHGRLRVREGEMFAVGRIIAACSKRMRRWHGRGCSRMQPPCIHNGPSANGGPRPPTHVADF